MGRTRCHVPKLEMVKENKHIAIFLTDLMPQRKTSVYAIFNKNEHGILGVVQWCSPWRQYCFYPEDGYTWSTSCLDTVVEFIKEINKTHKVKSGPQHMIQG